MAKRGTLTHRRTRRLAAALGVMPPFALGVLETLWHVTAENAPTGAIGRLCDQDLADEMYWDGDAGELVAGLVKAGALESHPTHRLVVHGWSEHADNATRHKLARARMTFWDGEPPFKRRGPEANHDQSPTDHGRTPTDHAETPADDGGPWSDEIEPSSDQRPVTSDQQPATSDQRLRNTPPSPPAGAGGPRPTRLTVGDRHPTTGGQVLEVADGVPIVAKASRQAYAGWLLILASAAVVAGPVLYHAALAWWHAQGPARQADLEAVAGRVSWVPGYLGLLAVSFGVAWVLARAFEVAARAVHPRGER